MARAYARDIKLSILTTLQGAAGLNYYLQLIDTERGENLYAAAQIKRFTDEYFTNQTAECLVKVMRSTPEDQTLGNMADYKEDNYSIDIIIKAANDLTTNLDNILDNYEEAVKRCLDSVKINSVAYCYYTGYEKQYMNDGSNSYSGQIVFNFTVRAN